MKILAVLLLICLSMATWGQTFEDVVNFDIELSSLHDSAIINDLIKSQSTVILEGVVGDIRIVDTADKPGVWVTLLGGEWIGTSEVRAYSCNVLFEGKSWVDAFTDKSQDSAPKKQVPRDGFLLIACRIIGYDDENGIPLAKMIGFRTLN